MTTSSQLLRIACGIEPCVTDGDLLRCYLQNQDEAAFTEIVRRNGQQVLRTCRSILKDTAAAEDAFQATFLVLARQANRLTQPGSLAGWLFATAVRISRSARRTDARIRHRESAWVPTPQISTDELTWGEIRGILDNELAALPEKYRLPLVLCYLQDLSYEEAAHRAGCPVGALRGRLKRGKEKLRKRLSRYGLPLAAPVLVLGPPIQLSAALEEATLRTVRAMATGGRLPAVVAEMAGPQISFRVTLLASVTLVLATMGVIFAVAANPAADLPTADQPPANLNKASDETSKRLDLFGDPLPDGVLARLGTLRSRACIQSFGLLADGTVVTLGSKLDIRTWSPKSDKSEILAQLQLADADEYLYPQVSVDGRFFAAGSKTKVVVWERQATSINEVATFEIKNTQKLALAPDGSHLAVAYERARHEGRIALYDVRTRVARELEPSAKSETLCFSGDGRRLLAESDQYAIVWDVQAGKLLAKHKLAQLGDNPRALSPTGAVIAVLPYCHGKDQVYFLDVSTGKPVEGWTGPEVNGDRFINYGTDGKTVLITSPKEIRWWDPVTGKLIRQFDAPSSMYGGWVRPQAQFTPDGKALVSHTRQMLFRWDAATGKPLFPPSQETGHSEAVAAMGVSPDGKRVATASWEVGVRIWDAETGRQLAVVPASVGNQQNLDFSPDGRYLFTPSQNCDAVVKWDVTTGKEATRFSTGVVEPWGGSLQGYRLAPDGRSIFAVTLFGEDKNGARIVTWDLESGRVLSEKPVAGVDFGMTGFSPDCRWGLSTGLVFPIAVGTQANILAGTELGGVRSLEFSWDSRLIAGTATASSGDKLSARVIVLEAATGAKIFEMPVPWVTSLAFHPDSRSLVGAVPDGLVFWDLTTGKEYARQKAHTPNLDRPQPFATLVRYFPNGKKVVTGHIDTTGLIWTAPDRPKREKNLDEKGRSSAWKDLASPDGSKGCAAVWALADDPGAVAMLREKLKPIPAMPEKEFDRLLADLGSEDFANREAATEKLRSEGESTVDQLLGSLNKELTPEQKKRVDQLLAVWKDADRRPPSGVRLRMIRAVAALELAGTPEARKLLTELAAGLASATTTREAKRALERVAR
jgi:RNA polymerase sigma factor (sigma-70 family)